MSADLVTIEQLRFLNAAARRKRNRERERRRRAKSADPADAAAAEADAPRGSKGKKKRDRRKGKGSDSAPYEHRTHCGETGRPIMTKGRLETIASDPSAAGLPGFLGDVSWEASKNLIHNAQRKMNYQLRYEHVTEEGPGHDRLFFATLRTSLDRECVGGLSASSSVANAGGTLELVNTGAARSKGHAERLAASDLIINLAEMAIDLSNPPDLMKVKKERGEDEFKAEVQRAQMILEVLDVSRPRFETVPLMKGRKQLGHRSEVAFYCRGTPIRASSEGLGDGRSKAEAEGRALVASVRPDGVLEGFVGKTKMDEIRYRIDDAPGGHVGSLHVRPLPEEAIDALVDAIGTPSAHEARMEGHIATRDAYHREFHERRRRRRRGGEREGGSGFRHAMGEQEAAKVNEEFAREEKLRAEGAASHPEGKQGRMKRVRDALPIRAIREELLDALASRQVVVVSGGTGSGKSTQCPQYILEDAISRGRGARTRVVVTQPRRIAAISVAERIAAERDEDIGRSVGYTVRFNRRAPRAAGGSVEFVTTGVLLRRLVGDPSLEGVSHVVIDEVHERDVDTDFLLVLLRDLLVRRPELRVVLMSATLDAESFAEYFSRGFDDGEGADPVPVMSVPTKPRYPVTVLHLEDMAREEGRAGAAAASSSTSSDPAAAIPRDVADLALSLLQLHDRQLEFDLEEALAEEAAASRLERRSAVEDEGGMFDSEDSGGSSSDSDSDDSDDDEEIAVFSSSSSPKARVNALQRAVSMRRMSRSVEDNKNATTMAKSLMPSEREIGEMTTRLLAKLARHVARAETDAGRKGSVLCFLPGLDEIKEAMVLLEEESDASLRRKMKILPLHSTIPQDDQQKVFIPANEGTIKVILSTNIAESSVTIDDVLAVIDSGLVREMNYDAEKSMSRMVTVPTSKASGTQRLGRAGRVAPGRCYRIYSKGQQAAMLERPMPEIQRTALEATCLSTCTLTDDSVETFLQRAMDPPRPEAVAHSMERLKKLGAITVDPSCPVGRERLSPLGHILSRLPLDPAMGRMLIMGCVMQCLDPVLTAAACFSSREVFYTPPGLRKEQGKAKRAFSEDSDMMASIRAYQSYQRILQEEGWDYARSWASDNFVSIAALSSIHSVRSQLLNDLHRIGFVHNSDLEDPRGRRKRLRREASLNRNADLESLHSAIWSCGLPDNLAARRQLGSFGTLRTRTENHAGLHPSSVAFHRKPPKEKKGPLPPWFSYREMVLSSQVFLRGCNSLTPEQILLFGGYSLGDMDKTTGGVKTQRATNDWDTLDSLEELSSKEANSQPKGKMVIDGWIVVGGQCDDTLDLLADARSEINAALDLKVMYPRKPLPEVQQEIIDGVCYCFGLLDGDQDETPRSERAKVKERQLKHDCFDVQDGEQDETPSSEIVPPLGVKKKEHFF